MQDADAVVLALWDGDRAGSQPIQVLGHLNAWILSGRIEAGHL